MCGLAPHRLPLPLSPLPIHHPRPSSPSIIHCCHLVSTKQYQFQAAYKLLTHITVEWRGSFISHGALVHPWKVHQNMSATSITDRQMEIIERRLVWTMQREDCKNYLHYTLRQSTDKTKILFIQIVIFWKFNHVY